MSEEFLVRLVDMIFVIVLIVLLPVFLDRRKRR